MNALDSQISRTATIRMVKNDEPAISLRKVLSVGGESLANKTEAAAISLRKRNILGTRFSAIALLDRSLSMSKMYQDGTVQTVVERALGWTLAVDDDGNIPVGLYGSTFEWGCDVDMTTFRDVVVRNGWAARGSTDLTGALRAARELATQSIDPVYLLVVTDGSPDDQESATREIVAMASEPIFIKFLLVGRSDPGRRYLEMLDDMEGVTGGLRLRRWGIQRRLLDNVDTKHVVAPSAMPDDAFAEVMTDEVDSWLVSARRAGLLR